MTVKENLTHKIEIFKAVFGSFLNEHGYVENSSEFRRLDGKGPHFPDLPMLSNKWYNSSKDLWFNFEVDTNYFVTINVVRTVKPTTLSLSSYKSANHINDLEIYLMPGETVDKKYESYLERIRELFRSNELSKVLTGEAWINIPMDWQNQK